MRRVPELLLFIVPFTILHAGCSFLASMLAYAQYRSPHAVAYQFVADVMLSPLRLVPRKLLPDDPIPALLCFGGNSLVWAVCIALLWALLRGVGKRRDTRGFAVVVRRRGIDSESA